MQPQCLSCKTNILPDWNFCPNCGKELRELPVPVSKQIFIYLISFFLAPLGLYWGVKYLRYQDKKIKIVGVISIVLTIVAVVLMMYAFMQAAQEYNNILKNASPF